MKKKKCFDWLYNAYIVFLYQFTQFHLFIIFTLKLNIFFHFFPWFEKIVRSMSSSSFQFLSVSFLNYPENPAKRSKRMKEDKRSSECTGWSPVYQKLLFMNFATWNRKVKINFCTVHRERRRKLSGHILKQT